MSLISLSGGGLNVTLDSCGAVLHSIVKDGLEYLWQGDPAYWKRRDANLFPYIGRLSEGRYLLDGKSYFLPTHGFCIGADFSVTSQGPDHIRFTLTDSPRTLEMYPFRFAFHVEYSLSGSAVRKTCLIENTGDREMYFGLGGHPGFQVPLGEGSAFSDWSLVFSEPCSPLRIDLDPSNYRLAGTESPFALAGGTTLPLEHRLFDLDAIVLRNVAETVTICSERSEHSVRVSYPGMPFLGLWHAPKTEAPYVCIEPWLSLPSHSAYVEDLSRQEHLAHLLPGKSFVRQMTIELA